jgi:hypothetical protein
MDAQVGPQQYFLERLAQRPGTSPVVQEILLHLVEHEIELAANLDRALREQIGKRRSGSRPAADRSRDGRDSVVSPAVDDGHVEAGGARTCNGHDAQTPNDARAQERALANADRTVQHSQPRRHQVGGNELRFALAAEEEARVERRVVEGNESLVR